LSEGRVVASGTPDELARSEEPVVRQFMSGAADGPVPFHFPAGDLATDILGQAEQARSRS
jgi:phospholipid/cholesterol/gamma-HCH transport system ATP-binding protein